MEWWSVVKKSAFESILHHSSTPIQSAQPLAAMANSATPKILEVERPIKGFAFFRVIVPFNFNNMHYFPEMFGAGGIK